MYRIEVTGVAFESEWYLEPWVKPRKRFREGHLQRLFCVAKTGRSCSPRTFDSDHGTERPCGDVHAIRSNDDWLPAHFVITRRWRRIGRRSSLCYIWGRLSRRPIRCSGDCGGASSQMKMATVLFLATTALVTGLIGAWKWYLSSKVEVDLGYDYPGAPPTYTRMGIKMPRGMEPVEPEQKWMNEIAATWEAMSQAGPLNKEAAAWTAASVALGTFCTVVGVVWPSN
jgi:hypothetical protein